MKKFLRNLFGVLYNNFTLYRESFILRSSGEVVLAQGKIDLINSKIDKDYIIDSKYFRYFIDPLVRRLYSYASKSEKCKRYKCLGGGATFGFPIEIKIPIPEISYLRTRLGITPTELTKDWYFGVSTVIPIQTYGNEEQYKTLCKEKCPVCPTIIYNPSAVSLALVELLMFEFSRYMHLMKDKINISKQKI